MKFVLFVDLDGTIIDANDTQRPFVHELFLTARMAGGRICVWSAGGAHYVGRQMARFPPLIQEMVDIMMGKAPGIDERVADGMERIYVDDAKALAATKQGLGHQAYRVPFYDGSSDDDHLFDVAVQIADRFGLDTIETINETINGE